jgi:hypothetical protein
MNEEQLSALLRIKRFEQPPPQYFDRLLQDIHRRQRTELLRRPLWKIAAERMQTFFSEHSMGHLSYAGALAGVLVVGVAGIGLMTSNRAVERPDAIAELAPTEKYVTLEPTRKSQHVLDSNTRLSSGALPGYVPAAAHQPRYVIDARPISYDVPPDSL